MERRLDIEENDLEEKVSPKDLPDKMTFEFKDDRKFLNYTGSKFLKAGEELTEIDIGELSDEERSVIYHGSMEMNFRGVLYLLLSSQSGINSRGRAVKRLIYNKSGKKPPEF